MRCRPGPAAEPRECRPRSRPRRPLALGGDAPRLRLTGLREACGRRTGEGERGIEVTLGEGGWRGGLQLEHAPTTSGPRVTGSKIQERRPARWRTSSFRAWSRRTSGHRIGSPGPQAGPREAAVERKTGTEVTGQRAATLRYTSSSPSRSSIAKPSAAGTAPQRAFGEGGKNLVEIAPPRRRPRPASRSGWPAAPGTGAGQPSPRRVRPGRVGGPTVHDLGASASRSPRLRRRQSARGATWSITQRLQSV